MPDRLLTPRFVTMWSYSFTVFISLFQLLPAAPYRVLELGGSTSEAGLFLGLLTYASAFSAPFTGSIADRVGQRRVLIVVSLILATISASYAFMTSYKLMLVLVVVHGLFWSGLLSASSAYMAATIPPSRRAEGLGYWGLASVTAIAAAPAVGFWVYRQGWAILCGEIVALNLIMTVIAWRLPRESHTPPETQEVKKSASQEVAARGLAKYVEWRVVVLGVTLGLIAFGYGGLTSFSALFADDLHISPRSLFLSAMAAAMLVGRLTIGRALDRLGHRRVLLPVLVAPAAGLLLLGVTYGPTLFIASAVTFGAGFGLMYPAFAAYVIAHVPPARRGAAFGAIIAAFDTGLGTGSTAMGSLIEAFGFRTAYLAAGALAILAVPYFLVTERLVWGRRGIEDLRSHH
ncbi:MAG TPA: MFS transporter [Vicinamibacterales bacterium]|nr:MFS transporter [Vicinamibacterales bacterium]